MKIRLVSSIILAAIMAVFVFSPKAAEPAQAANPRLYDWHSLHGNLYTTQSLLYFFQNLDSTVEYTMFVQELDVNGNVLRVIATRTLPTATTTSFIVLFQEWPTGFGPNQNQNYGLLRVQDQFGQTLGFHWISIQCHADWAGFSDLVALADVCRNNDVIPGFFHSKTDVAKSTYDSKYPEFTFLHYRTATSTTDRVHIYDLETNTVKDDFDLSAFIDYNEALWACNVGSCTQNALGVDGSNQFIILALNGDFSVQGFSRPPGVHPSAEYRAYTSGGLSNPTQFDVPIGAYDYHIRDSTDTTTVNGGMSTFIYSAKAVNENEWSISLPQSNVTASTAMTVTLTNRTASIGNAYVNHLLEDSSVGEIDNGTYVFNAIRKVTFTVDSLVQNNVNVTWTIGPDQLSVSGIDPTLYDFELTSANYNIIAAAVLPPFTERQRRLKTALGLDTVFGSTVLLTFFWILGFWASNKIQPGAHILQVAMFSLIGLGYWYVFDLPLLLKILFAISAIFLAIMAISNPRKEVA